MRVRQHVVHIDAPASRVWSVLTDLRQWPAMTPSMTEVSAVDAPQVEVGNRFLVRQPKLRPATWTVTEVHPGSSFTWASRAPGIRTVGRHSVEEVEGGTRLTLAVEQSGLLAPLVDRIAGALTERYIAMEGDGFKRRSEAPDRP